MEALTITEEALSIRWSCLAASVELDSCDFVRWNLLRQKAAFCDGMMKWFCISARSSSSHRSLIRPNVDLVMRVVDFDRKLFRWVCDQTKREDNQQFPFPSNSLPSYDLISILFEKYLKQSSLYWTYYFFFSSGFIGWLSATKNKSVLVYARHHPSCTLCASVWYCWLHSLI